MITREEFTTVIENMKTCDGYQDELNKFYRKHGVDGYLYQPDCLEDVAFLLKKLFRDEDDLVALFCFETEYGKLHKGIAKTEDGETVDLSSIDKLYDLLIERYCNE